MGHQAHKQLAAYAMTKAGIEMLAKNLVIEGQIPLFERLERLFDPA